MSPSIGTRVQNVVAFDGNPYIWWNYSMHSIHGIENNENIEKWNEWKKQQGDTCYNLLLWKLHKLIQLFNRFRGYLMLHHWDKWHWGEENEFCTCMLYEHWLWLHLLQAKNAQLTAWVRPGKEFIILQEEYEIIPSVT